MNINPSGFLWPEEEKLILFLIKAQEEAIAWDPTEPGNFRKDYLSRLSYQLFPTHMGRAQHPIPPGIYDEVVRIIKEKIKIGVYERSNSSYWSKWFCILKKDGKSLRIVHDLQPLNAVMVKDSGAPPPWSFMPRTWEAEGPILVWDSLSPLITETSSPIPGLNHIPDASRPSSPHHPSYGEPRTLYRSSKETYLSLYKKKCPT